MFKIVKAFYYYLAKGGRYRYSLKQLLKCPQVKDPFGIAEKLVGDETILYYRYKNHRLALKNEAGALHYILQGIAAIEQLVEKIELKDCNEAIGHGSEMYGQGKTVLDLGANVGLFSYFLKKKFPGLRIFLFEPSKELIEIIEENLKDFKNIEIIPKAVSHNNLPLTFYINPASQQTNSLKYSAVLPFVGSKKIIEKEVETVVLNEFVIEKKIANIDLLKIDIQGSEYQVLSHFKDFFPMINNLLVEVCFLMEDSVQINKLLADAFPKSKTLGGVIMGADILFHR